MADAEGLIVASAAFIVISGLLRKKRRKKRWWITSLYQNRVTCRGQSFLNRMVEEEENGHFRNFTRMCPTDFNFLLESIRADISRNDTKFRKPVTAEERLAITLRYLATGDSYTTSLQYLFNVSKQLISKIIPEVCRALVKVLSKYVKESPEFHIDENFKTGDVGQILGGLLIKGVITEGTKMQVGPMKDGSFQTVTIKSIHRNRVPCRMVRAGQSASICLDTNITGLRNGMVLLSNEQNANSCFYFQASVSVLFHATAIYPGFQTTVHIGNIRQTAVVIGICASKCIHTNERDSILFKFKVHPEYVTVGQSLLFREGAAKGIGEVTQVFPLSVTP